MTVERIALGKRPARPAKPARAPKAPSPERDSYHHGDLRAALLAAAEAELAENAIEAFTLRGCARRAGVSHAAPAHHFHDVRGLLTALAAIGFDRLSASMAAEAEGIARASPAYRRAIAVGYVQFAYASPQLFRLIFRVGVLDTNDPAFQAAGAAAFAYPVGAVAARHGVVDPMSNPTLAAEVVAMWSIIHGFSDLMLAGQFDAAAGGSRAHVVNRLLPTVLDTYLPDEAPRPKAPKRLRPSR